MVTEHNLQVNLITVCFPLAFHCYFSPHLHSNSSASFSLSSSSSSSSFIRIFLIILLLPLILLFYPSLPVNDFFLLRPQLSSFILLHNLFLHCLPLVFFTMSLSLHFFNT